MVFHRIFPQEAVKSSATKWFKQHPGWILSWSKKNQQPKNSKKTVHQQACWQMTTVFEQLVSVSKEYSRLGALLLWTCDICTLSCSSPWDIVQVSKRLWWQWVLNVFAMYPVQWRWKAAGVSLLSDLSSASVIHVVFFLGISLLCWTDWDASVFSKCL